ncbi:MAG: homoserine kinase [Enterobacterales bacterium]|nr:homoserine kinase [Enterobacterales bacterium]
MTVNQSKISVFAPVSIGNVSVGFDNLGLAVAPVDGTLLGDIVSAELAINGQKDQLINQGAYQNILPTNKEDNLVWYCLLEFNQALKQIGQVPQVLQLTLEKNIPICSGLGSSACSVVAGLTALNEFYNKPFSDQQLLTMMGTLEGKMSGSIHYDNVAPCYLGGMQLMIDDGQNVCHSIPLFDDCYWVIGFPNIEISTKMAREILPKQYARADLIAYGSHLAGFIAACYAKNKQQAFALMKDFVAEPYRKGLLDNFETTQQKLLKLGVLAQGISGSGPTIFAVTDNLLQAEKIKQLFDQFYCLNENSFSHICKADQQGARVL